MEVPGRKGAITVVRDDEGLRPDTSAEKLATLRTIVSGGEVITAGNSSTLNDGASAIIIVSEGAVDRLGLTPRVRVVTCASSGVAPEIMGIGPVPAMHRALDQAGWELDSLGAMDLNEAFAPRALACLDQRSASHRPGDRQH